MYSRLNWRRTLSAVVHQIGVVRFAGWMVRVNWLDSAIHSRAGAKDVPHILKSNMAAGRCSFTAIGILESIEAHHQSVAPSSILIKSPSVVNNSRPPLWRKWRVMAIAWFGLDLSLPRLKRNDSAAKFNNGQSVRQCSHCQGPLTGWPLKLSKAI